MFPYIVSWLVIAFAGWNLIITWFAYRPRRRLIVMWCASVGVLQAGLVIAAAVNWGYIPVIDLDHGTFLAYIPWIGEMHVRLWRSQLAHSPHDLARLIAIHAFMPIVCMIMGEILYELRSDEDKDLRKLPASEQD